MQNKGERKIQGIAMDGTPLHLTAHATDVGKPLMSAQDISKKGNEVVFTHDRSRIPKL